MGWERDFESIRESIRELFHPRHSRWNEWKSTAGWTLGQLDPFNINQSPLVWTRLATHRIVELANLGINQPSVIRLIKIKFINDLFFFFFLKRFSSIFFEACAKHNKTNCSISFCIISSYKFRITRVENYVRNVSSWRKINVEEF